METLQWLNVNTSCLIFFVMREVVELMDSVKPPKRSESSQA